MSLRLSSHTWLSLMLGAVTAALFAWLSWRIDFHPDEAIYYDGIPSALRNDTGAFYNLLYGLIAWFHPSPQGARLASALLGGGTFVAVAVAFRELGLDRRRHLAGLWILFAIAYQSIFVFVRVRPEAAWWFCAAWLVAALIHAHRTQKTGLALAWLLIPALLLPMNHRLCWFACAYCVLYALFFLYRRADWPRALVLGGGLLAGAILNVAGRALWLGVPVFPALRDSLQSPAAAPQGFGEFVNLVFVGSPAFLNDTAQYRNLYESLAGHTDFWLSHAFVQTCFWLAMLPLPFLGRNGRERFAFAFPLFAFLAFWRSGYYNPTYAPGFSLLCLLMLATLIGHAGWRRWVALPLLLLSIVNGMSFLATRVLDHGRATYFGNVAAIREIVAEQARAGHGKVALPERMSPVVGDMHLARTVDFKEDVPTDIDVLILDDYDWMMYAFVPDFEKKKADLTRQAARMCLVRSFPRSTYEGDTLFAPLQADEKAAQPGSWFFRNSTRSNIRVYVRCPARVLSKPMP